MTCRYSLTEWTDVLYVSVRKTPGGVADAAAFLTHRRGRSIHTESLRAKLRGLEGESISVEMAELLTEWMEEKAQPHAYDWLHALNSRFNLVSTARVEAGESSCIQSTLIDKTVAFGAMAKEVADALGDGVITALEAGRIEEIARENQRFTETLIQIARNIAGVPANKGRAVK